MSKKTFVVAAYNAKIAKALLEKDALTTTRTMLKAKGE